jgi:hypothetical protein
MAGDSYLAALLSPLTETHPILMHNDERPADFSGLNRHLVLHGDSLDYNTRINSARALSLVAYLSWILAEVATRDIATKQCS